MWFFLFVNFFVKTVISENYIYNSPNYEINTESAIYNKCCPKHLELMEVSNNNTVRYECVNHELSNLTYNITNSTLVASDIAASLSMIIEECDKLHDIDYTSAAEVERNNTFNFGSVRKSGIHCYDTLIKQINYTKTENFPESSLLTCVQTKAQNILEPIFKINHIKKCCPMGHDYDINDHICKKNNIENREEWLTKLLNTSYSYYYIYEIAELNCEWNEYILDLSEDTFLLKVENSILDVTDKHWKQNNRVSPGQWCVDRQYGNLNLVARICTKECGIYNAFCFQKCCPFGLYYDSDEADCREFDHDIITFNISYYLDNFRKHANFTDILGIKTSNEYCIESNSRREIIPLNKSLTDDIHDFKWEDLLKINSNRMNTYCLETLVKPQNQDEVIVTHFKCDDSPKFKNFRKAFMLNTISSIFLALTLLVYCALPELHNLHGWTLICHVSTMLLAYSSIARVQYGRVEDPNFCIFLGYAIYFGYMSAFLWLSVICFDIWLKHGTIREIKDEISKKKEEKRKFILYSLYAWGTVIVFTIIMIAFDYYPVSKYLDADMGEGRCFFSSILTAETYWPEYIYFRIPIALLVSANIVLWVLIASSFGCICVMSSNNSCNKTTFRSAKARYILTAKLGLLMGGTWVFECLSVLTSEPPLLWEITDSINELQGFFIFIILVCNSKIYNLLKIKIDKVKRVTRSKSITSIDTNSIPSDKLEQHELQDSINGSSKSN